MTESYPDVVNAWALALQGATAKPNEFLIYALADNSEEGAKQVESDLDAAKPGDFVAVGVRFANLMETTTLHVQPHLWATGWGAEGNVDPQVCRLGAKWATERPGGGAGGVWCRGRTLFSPPEMRCSTTTGHENRCDTMVIVSEGGARTVPMRQPGQQHPRVGTAGRDAHPTNDGEAELSRKQSKPIAIQ